MTSWTGKTRGGIHGYKSIVWIVRHFGLSLAYFFLHFTILYFILASRGTRQAQYSYFRIIHQFSPWKSAICIYKNFHIFGQILIDKIAILSNTKTNLRFEFEGESYLHSMAAEGRGGMLLSAHIGSFEMAGHLLKRINIPVNILMFEAEHEHIKHYLSEIYKNINANIITIKDDMSHIFEISRVFENKEFLCLHGDRFLDGSRTQSIDFLGHTAQFPIGPFLLAAKFNIPVSFVFAMKDSPSKYHFYASEPRLYYQEKLHLQKRAEVIADIMKEYISSLENILGKYPGQWFNYYPFWEELKD